MALWLCPREGSAAHDKLSTLMTSLGTLFPGLPPLFEPHVTITSNISVDLQNPQQTRDDVDRILSASAAALNSLPNHETCLVSLLDLALLRSYFKKLYFDVERNANLVSLSQIIHELFVILPGLVELENLKVNPHLFSKCSDGSLKQRKRGHRTLKHIDSLKIETKQLDLEELQRQASVEATQWAKEYRPHLSLIYSEINHIDMAMMRTIRTRVSDYLDISDFDCTQISNEPFGWDRGVLKLVLCEGNVKDWVVLASVDIQ